MPLFQINEKLVRRTVFIYNFLFNNLYYACSGVLVLVGGDTKSLARQKGPSDYGFINNVSIFVSIQFPILHGLIESPTIVEKMMAWLTASARQHLGTLLGFPSSVVLSGGFQSMIFSNSNT